MNKMDLPDDDVKDTVWLDQILLAAKVATKSNSEAKKCVDQRSENPSDYMILVQETLKSTSEVIEKVGEVEKSFTREKNNVESRKLREEGNKIFQVNKKLDGLEKSLELYTKSIAYAIPNTPEMAMGFANRSAVLLRLYRPKESLEDIERAFNSNYPEELMLKLHIRQGECFSMLAGHSYIQAKFWLEQLPKDDPERKRLGKYVKDYSIKDYKYIVDEADAVVPEIASPHADFPCASDAIDVEYSGPTGRKVVATRDIRVGEVLVVEKLYLSQLFVSAYYAYCWHCQESLWTGIPCDNCPNVVYCSEKCKLAAWRDYHSVECPALNLVLQNQTSYIYKSPKFITAIASLKLLIKFSHEAGGLLALQERIEKFHKCSNDRKVQSQWYKNQTLESFLTLDSKVKKIPDEDFLTITAAATYLLFHLATTTSFFGVQYKRNIMSDKEIVLSMAHNKYIQFTGGLLTKLLLIAKNNRILAKEEIRSFNLVNHPGIVVPTFLQLISSKCYYNASEQFIGEHVILHSLAPIKKGEEVSQLLCSWMLMPREKRLSEHNNRNIECFCRACEENWPTLSNLESFEDRAKSSESKALLQKILQPLESIKKDVAGKIVKGNDDALNNLKSMMEAIYDGVNLPCKEQAEIYLLLSSMYEHKTSRRKWRQDVNLQSELGDKLQLEEFNAFFKKYLT